jgi:hypothetical protein
MDDHYLTVKPEAHNWSRNFSIIKFPFPVELERDLERLYKNVFCSVPNIKNVIDFSSLFAYVSVSNLNPEQIILFSHKGSSVVVINELFTMPATDLLMFVKSIFSNFANVRMIVFPSLRTNANVAEFPLQRFNSTEDIVISLPKSIEEYSSSLGKNTRETVSRFRRRIAARYPAIEFLSFERDKITPSVVAKIVELNCLRIRSKNQVPSHTAESLDWLYRITQKFGIVVLAMQGERICGGVICTNINGKFFMHVIAHDSEFDVVRMGKICCYLSICDAINKGGSEYHMLSGEYDYKSKFLGKKFEYERISIYRSKKAVLSMLPSFIEAELKGRGRSLKKKLKKYHSAFKR